MKGSSRQWGDPPSWAVGARPTGASKSADARRNRRLNRRFFQRLPTLRLLNALNSEDRGLKVRFSLATIAFDRESAQMS